MFDRDRGLKEDPSPLLQAVVIILGLPTSVVAMLELVEYIGILGSLSVGLSIVLLGVIILQYIHLKFTDSFYSTLVDSGAIPGPSKIDRLREITPLLENTTKKQIDNFYEELFDLSRAERSQMMKYNQRLRNEIITRKTINMLINYYPPEEINENKVAEVINSQDLIIADEKDSEN